MVKFSYTWCNGNCYKVIICYTCQVLILLLHVQSRPPCNYFDLWPSGAGICWTEVVLVYLNPQFVNVSPSPELVRQGFFINAIIFRLVDTPLFNMNTCYHGQNPVFHWKLLQDLTVNNSHNYRLLLLRDYGHIHGTKMTILFWFLIKHTMYFSCNINMQHYSLLFIICQK